VDKPREGAAIAQAAVAINAARELVGRISAEVARGSRVRQRAAELGIKKPSSERDA
jgi:hypothetical protein